MERTPGAVAIETERLVLRNWREGDADAFHIHCNTEAVMRWLGGVQSRAFYDEVAARLARWQEDRGFTFWVVERREDGAFLGFCGLKIADGAGSSVTGEVEAGWRFREDAWGQGYAKEAATATLSFAFDTLHAERVVAITFQKNEASWGLMKRLGMRRRADLDYDDPRFGPDLNPTIIYEIGRNEWTA
ncbi:GNAT family N-acetyltransferase [Allosphingosinicella vermicomposti]|uniref:GNAT family N-acetyltransferase n=1 Tax=Allosphingosinicella vermicomposti TaxID=614671 RepID=UPI000D104678|nr:GNAT family N-acetyltransferase [Allosphingosinicella vermicomposti]